MLRSRFQILHQERQEAHKLAQKLEDVHVQVQRGKIKHWLRGLATERAKRRADAKAAEA